MNEIKKNPVFRVLSSYGLSVILLLVLLLLTYLGTLEQREFGIYKIQQKYFESFYLFFQAGPIPIPLPGAYLVMVVLFVNLLLGGLMRVRWTWKGAGVITTHAGILFLLVASFVSFSSSVHGSVTLFEGESTSEFRSHHEWEIAVYPAPEGPGGKPVTEYLIPHREFVEISDAAFRTYRGEDLPLEFTLNYLMENSEPRLLDPRRPARPDAVDGVYLDELPSEKEAEHNILGAYIMVRLAGKTEEQLAILWGGGGYPLLVNTPKGRWAIELRKKRSNLPFGLRLDKFTHEYYPGTGMPKVFMSDVTMYGVGPDEGGSGRKIKIEMNQPLRSEGFTVYQSNWGPQRGAPNRRLFSGFSVVTNPSDQWPLYACIVIGLGLVIHFGRMLFRYLLKTMANAPAAAATALVAALLLSGCRPGPTPVEPRPTPSNTWGKETIALLETLPVQDGGRVKPLHTFARYRLLGMNGKTKVKLAEKQGSGEPVTRKITATEWLLDVLFTPEVANRYPVFNIRNDEVLDAIEIGHRGRKKADRYSYAEIAPGLQDLSRLYQEYRRIDPKNRDQVENQIVELGDNVLVYQTLVTAVRGIADGNVRGRTLAIFPAAGGADQAWLTPVELRSVVLSNPRGLEAQGALLATLGEIARAPTDAKVAEPKLRELHDGIVGLAKARGEYGKVELEVSFYHSAWFHWGLGFFAIGFVMVAFTWLVPRFWPLYWGSFLVTAFALAVTTIGITQRCIIRGRPPVNTLYETILFVAATAALTALIVEIINRRRIALSVATVLGLAGLFLAMKYEEIKGVDTFTPLVAVLRTNFWLATHVTTVTLGYSAGLLAAAVAMVHVIGRLFVPTGAEEFFKSLGRMVYGIICFGLIFSVIGTILGGIWANDSWGRFWGWDPKENGALMIVLWELAMLHARRGGYIKDFGFAMASIAGAIIVVFSWFGVNLLGVGLHTYGFTKDLQTAVQVSYGGLGFVMLLGGIAWVRMMLASEAEKAVVAE